jgi:hypothetical protein
MGMNANRIQVALPRMQRQAETEAEDLSRNRGCCRPGRSRSWQRA